MKIEDNRINEITVFYDVIPGETFVDVDENVYIRIEDVRGIDTDIIYNAMGFENGEVYHFQQDEEIRAIKAKVVIE